MFMNTTKEEFAERLKKLHVESPSVKKPGKFSIQ